MSRVLSITYNKVKKFNKRNSGPVNAAFKCRVCGETDEDQTGSKCGNTDCPYK